METGKWGTYHFCDFVHNADPEFALAQDLLEAWFEHYPMDEKRRLKRDFYSSEWKWYAPLSELFVHEVCRLHGVELRAHPGSSGKNPDFLVSKNNNNICVVEVTCILHNSKLEDIEDKKKCDLINKINEHQSDGYKFGIEVNICGDRYLPKKRIWNELDKVFLELQRDFARDDFTRSKVSRRFREYKIEIGDWQFTLTLLKRDSRNGSLIASTSVSSWPGLSDKIRKSLSEKHPSKYSSNLPYVLAIVVADPICSVRDFVSALYGDETMLFNRDSGAYSGEGRQANGAWSNTRGWKSKGFSAIMGFTGINVVDLTRSQGYLFLHPEAANPLDFSFQHLIQLQVDKTTGYLNVQDGSSLSDILHKRN
ncbi:MAG: hypothetical protein R3F46_15390 [bacterium]